MTDLRESRRRQYLGLFAHGQEDADDPIVGMGVGDVTWTTLDRVTPGVQA